MKKFLGIFLVFTMFMTMGSAAFADCVQNLPQKANSCSCYVYQQYWNCLGGMNQACSGNFWQQFGDKFEWQEDSSNDTSDSTPSENPAETPETDSSTDSSTNSSYIEQVAALVNSERAKEGLAPLTLDEELSAAAQVRAVEAATSFSHTRPNGSSCFTALKEAGISYRGAGENIAYGQTTPAEVMKDWLNSSGHRANIMSEKFTKIGVGYTVINGVAYWSQFFTY